MSIDATSLSDRFLPYSVYPAWLGEEEADALLDFAEASRESFLPSAVRRQGLKAVDTAMRNSLRLADLGPFASGFRERLAGMVPELCQRLGMPRFEPKRIELELVAHGDGAHFGRHSDTFVGKDAPLLPRRVSAISYLYRRPKGFTGGALRYYTLSSRRSIDLEPEHRLMLAFPSFAPHSVERVSVPSGDFRDFRFAIDIWVNG